MFSKISWYFPTLQTRPDTTENTTSIIGKWQLEHNQNIT